MKLRNIEILHPESSRRGDLFARLMGDLFHSLGYGEPRINIHKAGREIDLSCRHRTEKRIAIVECKAEKEPIGGADINKFVGVLDLEHRKLAKNEEFKKYAVVGYFVSLSGFKETATEQELDGGNTRLILIKQDKIIEELVNSRILVSIDKAISSLTCSVQDLTLLEIADLIAFERGWVWVIYFSQNGGQKCTHFALVHAEGRPLINEIANEIIETDKKSNFIFKDLILINTTVEENRLDNQTDEAQTKYFKYLQNELGDIQFEGLPTDKEAGSVKVQLENIFVPLYLELRPNEKKSNNREKPTDKEGIGEILNKNAKIAILAKPGAGKSTLIKRIAISYAFPNRRKLINDLLPDKNWFPIFIRCRELGDRVMLSITEIINGIPTRAEISWHSAGFIHLVSNALQNGNALLLIDGLDEISEDKNRVVFVNQLRTFLATYPSINIIVTSREAGFRAVGGVLTAYCEHYTISNLTNLEIEELSIKWHKAIIDESDNTIKEAKKIANIIVKDSRIRVLAENPLLLTTLLFVKRWAGYLPTKKTVLYQEMIKLLLVTWNVEGHEQLDIEEAEPQLCYVAFWMSINGKQTISEEELRNCLIDARVQMPEILGYTKISPHEFIRRVESRSSLLILSGHQRLESGTLIQIYEFLHLSFQEYLAAKAIVKGYIPNKFNALKKVDIVESHMKKENWKEIIPILAVLLERDCKELIELLIYQSKQLSKLRKTSNGKARVRFAAVLLGNCLANEIQINPNILDEAIEWFAKNKYSVDRRLIEIILNNKFGNAFRKKTHECFFDQYEDTYASVLGSILSDIFLNDNHSESDYAYFDQIKLKIKSEDWKEKTVGFFALMGFFYSRPNLILPFSSDILDIYKTAINEIKCDHKQLKLAIVWSIAWAGERSVFPESLRREYSIEMIFQWLITEDYNFRRICSWALARILTSDIPRKLLAISEYQQDVIFSRMKDPENEYDAVVALFLMSIKGFDIDTAKATRILKRHMSLQTSNRDISNYKELAKELGIDWSKMAEDTRRRISESHLTD